MLGTAVSGVLRTCCAIFFVVVTALMASIEPRTAVLAIVCGVVAIVCLFISPVRFAGFRISRPIVAVVAWLTIFAALTPFSERRYTAAELAREAEPLIRQLDEYRAAEGSYPKNLASAGIVPPSFRGLKVDYVVDEAGEVSIQLGDYMQDGYTANWSSKRREWYFDS